MDVIIITMLKEFTVDSVTSGRLPCAHEMPDAGTGTGSESAPLPPLNGGGRASYHITINNYAGNGKQSFC